MRTLHTAAQVCMQKWGKKAGDKSITYLTRWAQKRGLAHRSYDLDSLSAELNRMYQQGKFSRAEWAQIKSRLAEAIKARNRPPGS